MSADAFTAMDFTQCFIPVLSLLLSELSQCSDSSSAIIVFYYGKSPPPLTLLESGSADAFTGAELVKRLANEEETYFDPALFQTINPTLSSLSPSPEPSPPGSGFEPFRIPI
jgi:hypothetical protein